MKLFILLASAIVIGTLFTGCGCSMDINTTSPTVPMTTSPTAPDRPSLPDGSMTEPSLKPNIPDPSINDGSTATSPMPSFEQKETEN